MPPAILNTENVEYLEMGHGDAFQARISRISDRLGARQLGYNVTIIPPGKRAFPFHCHRVNEEMFFVLEGEGEVRLGEERHPLRPGDVLSCPAGGRETAHQIINTSSADLTFLAVSTRLSPELCEYPDSDKFGVMSESAGPDGAKQMFRYVGREAGSLGYWDGEGGSVPES